MFRVGSFARKKNTPCLNFLMILWLMRHGIFNLIFFMQNAAPYLIFDIVFGVSCISQKLIRYSLMYDNLFSYTREIQMYNYENDAILQNF